MANTDFRVKNGLVVQEDAIILSTTDSTSKDTGALLVDGGAGIEKDVYIGQNLDVEQGIIRSGDIQASAWGINGIAFNSISSTFTDVDSATGTVPKIALHSFQPQTINSSNTVTYTDAANVYIAGGLTNGTGATFTESWALLVDGGNVKFDTDVYVTGNLNVGGGAQGVGVNVTTDLAIDGSLVVGDAVTDTITFTGDKAFAPNTLTLIIDDSNSGGVTDLLTLRHTASTTPGTGIGVGLAFEAETAESNLEVLGIMQVSTEDATAGIEDAQFKLYLQQNGDPALSNEVFSISSEGTGTLLNNLVVQGNTISSSSTTFNLLDTSTTTINFGGAATNINMLPTNGTLNLNSTVDAISLTSGALVVDGGASFQKNVYAGGLQETPVGNIGRSSGAFTTLAANSTVTLNPANNNVQITPTGTGTLTIQPATEGTMNNVAIGASTAASGAFTTLSASGDTTITSATASTDTTTGALVVSGGVGIGGKVSAGTANLNGNVFATNSTTGTLVVTGGVGISQNLYVGGDFEVTGDFTVDGVNAQINATNLTVDDSIIRLNGDTNLTQTNSKDVGIIFPYYANDASRLGFMGYDESDQVFRLLTDASINNEVVSGTRATLFANLVGDFSTDNIVVTGGSIDGTPIGATTADTGAFTTLAASGVTTITDNTNSTSTTTGALVVSGGAGFALDVYAGSFQGDIGDITRGTGAFTTLAANSTVTINGSNANVTISPTGTGAVDIEPAGGISIDPGTTGTLDNITIGGVTPKAGSFVALNASGLVRLTDTTDTTNTTSGAVVISGGAAIGKKLNVGALTSTVGLTSTGTTNLSPNNLNVTISPSGTGQVFIQPATAGNIDNMIIGASNAAAGTFTAITGSGLARITNTTASTDSTSGALVVTGGVGIGDDLFIGGSASMVGLTATGATAINPPNNNVSIQPTGSGTVTIAPATAGNINNMNIGSTTRASGAFTTLSANSTVNFTATTASTGTGTGALIVAGGVGIGGTLNVGGDVNVTGSLSLGGGQTVIESTTITVEDPTLTLGGNPQSDDNKDRGIEFKWHTGTAQKTGFFGFDDSTGKFVFIPEATAVADVYSGTTGTILASLEGNLTSSSVTITGGSINSTPIGNTTPSSGAFTTLSTSGNATFGDDATADTVSFANARIASALVPSTDDTRDLGSSSLQWRNLYIDGTANIDSLVADTVDINAGNIDNTAIGSTTRSSGAFTSLAANAAVAFTANTASTSTTTGTAVITGGLGVSGAIHAGSITSGSVSFSGAISLSPANANVTISPTGTGTVNMAPATTGTINNMSIGATTRSSGDFTTLSANNLVDFTNTTASTSTSTGALVVSGGVGIAGDIYAGGLEGTPIGGDSASTAAFTSLSASGAVTFTQNTASSSKTTGTLVVTGGVGVSEDVYADRFVGPLVGNASTADKLSTARSIDIGTAVTATATDFDGSANITIPITGINADYLDSGTVNDARLPDSISSNITGNAASASVLNPGRNINGVAFDGSQDITVADNTKMPTGGGTFTGNVTFNDNVVLRFGTGADVEHFWNGSNYYTDINGGGNWFIRDGNSSNATRYTFDVDNGDLTMTGTLVARDKEFLIDHPTKEGMKLRHGVLEGPEHSVYVRGKLVDAHVIELPDYWTGLVHEDTITVSLTAFGDYNEYWVERIEDNKVYIKSTYDRVSCFYHVFAERKDVDRFDVEFKED